MRPLRPPSIGMQKNMNPQIKIPFNRPTFVKNSLEYLSAATTNNRLSGNQEWTKKSEKLLENHFGAKVLLTSSCTAALEMTSLLLDIQPGDEVIIPDFTFVSTANAFALRGAKIIFADIDRKTLNICPDSVEKSISDKTKAIVLVHYAGNPCPFTAFEQYKNKGIHIIEDAAHCMGANFQGKAIGTFGDFATFSFHETKNLSCGEGGALLINNSNFIKRAEVIREKGTNRSEFFRGEVNKYEWKDLGSNYLMSELQAAYLYGQLEELQTVTEKRKKIWLTYQEAFSNLTAPIQTPKVTDKDGINGHIYYLILDSEKHRDGLMQTLKQQGIQCSFHYQPLHLSRAGSEYGTTRSPMNNSIELSQQMIRLPLFESLSDNEQSQVIESILTWTKKTYS